MRWSLVGPASSIRHTSTCVLWCVDVWDAAPRGSLHTPHGRNGERPPPPLITVSSRPSLPTSLPPHSPVRLCPGRGRSAGTVVQARERMRGANDAFLSLDLERLEAMEEVARLKSEIGRLRTAMGGRLVGARHAHACAYAAHVLAHARTAHAHAHTHAHAHAHTWRRSDARVHGSYGCFSVPERRPLLLVPLPTPPPTYPCICCTAASAGL